MNATAREDERQLQETRRAQLIACGYGYRTAAYMALWGLTNWSDIPDRTRDLLLCHPGESGPIRCADCGTLTQPAVMVDIGATNDIVRRLVCAVCATPIARNSRP